MAKLNANVREGKGTHQAQKLRRAAQIPGIIYGHGQENQPVSLSEHDLAIAIQHGERLLEVTVGKKTENVLIKEVQYDTFGHHILHVDMARVDLDERVEITVPIVLRGTPAGAADGGVLQQIAAEVTIECLVRAMPEEIVVPVTEMKIDDMLHMGELPLPEGSTLAEDPETVVCNVTLIAEEEETEAAEGEETAEPEVIGEKKEEDEEGESDKE